MSDEKRSGTLPISGGHCLPEAVCAAAAALPGRNRFAVVLPVYNHGRTLAAVVRQAAGLGLPVFVVDDGSTDDGLAGLSPGRGLTLLRHRVNRGKGAALVTGLRAAARCADWGISLDADGQHHPGDALGLISAIPAGSRPVVIGSRLEMLAAGAPWTSRFGREFSNFWIKAAGGPAVTDSQSGFRIYPLPETLRLGVLARRYQFEIEVLIKAAWQGIPVIEAPIQVTYRCGFERISHFRPFVDFLRNTGVFARLIFARVRGRATGHGN